MVSKYPEGVVAVINPGSVLAAALAIPTLAIHAIAAQALPSTSGASLTNEMPATNAGEQVFNLRWLSYRDWQPGFDRIKVHAPAAGLQLSLSESLWLDASATVDSVSGASPRYHSAVSGASAMVDRRNAGTLGLRYRVGQWQWAGGLARSKENDFDSRAATAQLAWETEDKNRRFNVGLGRRLDQIGSVNDPILHESRQTTEISLALSQVMSARDVVQLAYWRSSGEGYFSDPYKLPDERPRDRLQQSLQWRWNHYQTSLQIPLRFGYRYYNDSFGVRAHTLWLEPQFNVSDRLSFIPTVRLYNQSAASFYYNPRYAYRGIPIPEGYQPGLSQWVSADQRLASFGALTLGVQWIFQIDKHYSLDFGVYRYEQRTSWHWISPGSRGLEPLRAVSLHSGISYRF